ncbi:prohibitin family protein [Thiothrix lacustris]|uniref:prohibitin family protein n=1 Tax=Thiothrix lacustris TaxID=525917 RepID=UPI0027E5A9BA|nr:prohibitin family protein [Thiothrix lacustris]WMP19406.1 prohibitin family protein [Thiothrix lacustris]
MENTETSIHAQFKRWLRRKSSLLIVLSLLTALGTVILWPRIVITVQPGEAGILFYRFGGTEIDKVYGEGLHIFNPINTVFIYEVRKQVAFHEFDVISNKGLTVHLSLAVRYRPEYDMLGILHQRIGPDYLQRVILPQIESVMRKELGNYTAEQIYTNDAGLLTKAILSATDEVGRNYVEVEDIIIRSITMPPEIVEAIESKLKQEEFMKSYEFRMKTAEKEAERLKIEAEGIQTYHNIINSSLSEAILRNKGIEATEKLATSNNAKVVVIGSGKDGLPIILNTEQSNPTTIVSPSETKEPTGNASMGDEQDSQDTTDKPSKTTREHTP